MSSTHSSHQPLGVGIIGLGKMGRIRARHIQERDDLDLRVVCDIDRRKADAMPHAAFCEQHGQLLDHDIDIVFICTYNNLSTDLVVEALNKGKSVFCEKPPGRSVEDVQRIIEAERANPGVQLQFGFNHRHHYAVMEAKSMADSGRFGDLLWLRGIYGKCGGVDFVSSWRNDVRISGGGILLDQGIHMLDLFRLFAGDFSDVQSVVTTSYWDIPVEDNAFAILTNDRNQVALLHSSATQWKHRFSLELCLAHGYINIDGLLTSTRSYGEEKLVYARRQFEDESRAVGRPREETIFYDRDDSWALEISQFVSAIREHRPVTSGGSADALRAMELVELIYDRGRR